MLGRAELVQVLSKSGPLCPEELLSAELYEASRSKLLSAGRRLKSARRLSLGPHFSLLFEDRASVWLQVHEELRWLTSRTPGSVREVLDRYDVLVPQSDEFRASLFLDTRIPQVAKNYALHYTVADLRIALSLDGHRYDVTTLDGAQDWLSAVSYICFSRTRREPDAPDGVEWYAPEPNHVALSPETTHALLRELHGPYLDSRDEQRPWGDLTLA